jgi:hypothetical protein
MVGSLTNCRYIPIALCLRHIPVVFPVYHMGHFINNAQGGAIPVKVMRGSNMCVHYFTSLRHFELTSVRHGICRCLGYCDG